MKDQSKFEVIVVPNIFSASYGLKGEFAEIIPTETYDEAISEMKRDIECSKNSPIANCYHYDILEYDDENRDDIINELVFDYQGREIKDFEEWVENLSEKELKEPNEKELMEMFEEERETKNETN